LLNSPIRSASSSFWIHGADPLFRQADHFAFAGWPTGGPVELPLCSNPCWARMTAGYASAFSRDPHEAGQAASVVRKSLPAAQGRAGGPRTVAVRRDNPVNQKVALLRLREFGCREVMEVVNRQT
jgi:hypothetical protein